MELPVTQLDEGFQKEGLVHDCTYKLESPHSHTETPLDSTQQVWIGREEQYCAIAFPDCAVLSRIHCKVFLVGRDVWLEDCSTNGTFVNGALVGKGKRVKLRSGDLIQGRNPAKMSKDSSSEPKLEWNFWCSDPGLSGTSNDSLDALKKIVSWDEKVIGQGGFATVFRGVLKQTGEKVALKVITKRRLCSLEGPGGGSAMPKLLNEVEILRTMSHPNIIRIHNAFDLDTCFVLVMELVEHGDMFDYIVGRRKFTEEEVKLLLVQLIDALLYMHSKGIVHRDLKPENILIDVLPGTEIPEFKEGQYQHNAKNIPVGSVRLKITDFGLAKFCKSHGIMTTQNVGTDSYMAPEVQLYAGTGYTASVDVWSLGSILHILFTGAMYVGPRKAPDHVSDEAWAFLGGMLENNPQRRLTLHDIVNHPWLAGADIPNRHLADSQRSATLPPTIGDELTQRASVATVLTPSSMVDPTSQQMQKKRLRDEETSMAPPQITWYWKKNLKLIDDNDAAWEPYSDVQSAKIEEKMRAKEETCELGDYAISFKDMWQYRQDDPSKKRRVRRLLPSETRRVGKRTSTKKR